MFVSDFSQNSECPNCVYGLRLQLTAVTVSQCEGNTVCWLYCHCRGQQEGIMKLYENSSGREKEEKHPSFHLIWGTLSLYNLRQS